MRLSKDAAGRNVMRGTSIVTISVVLIFAATLACPAVVQAQSASQPSTGTIMPSDIDARSGMRLPLPNRDDLDEAGKKAYDRGTTPGATIAGLQGPSGIQLYSL